MQEKSSSKGTIIYICQFAGTEQNGMNYRPFYLGKYAVERGYRFIVVGSGFHHQMKTPKNLANKPLYEKIKGIDYIWMPAKTYKAKRYIERVMSLFAFPFYLFRFNIKKIVGKEKVLAVVSSSPSLLSSLPAIRWAKKLGTKFIFEVRDIWPLSLVELSGVSGKNPFIAFLKHVERKSYRKADKVFTVLSNSKEYMRENGLDPDKFNYIPNGVDNIRRRDYASHRDEHDFSDAFTIGYAGTIGVANNLSNLINAAGILGKEKHIHFAIIGDGPKKKEIQEQAEGCENVTFMPTVSKDLINGVLETFGAGYLGLRRGKMFEYGISPNKLFDYMLAEIPVILAVNTKNSIVERAGCGLVIQPDDPEDLAEKILLLSRMSRDERRQMGRNGYEYVVKHHSYENITDLFIQSIT